MPGPTACAARLRRFLLGTAALLPSLLPAQQPLPADLDELARMVDAAHKTDAASSNCRSPSSTGAIPRRTAPTR